METIKIRKWDTWQTYRKDRDPPPWIKVHRCVMRNPEWVSLTDAERGQLVSMWLLAADKDGELPADPALIQKLCYMEKKPDLNKFTDLGFICPNGVKLASSWRQDDVPEKKRVEKKRVERPGKNDVINYFTENGFTKSSAIKAFEYYEAGDWKDSRGNVVKNWKQKMRGVWFKDENRETASTYKTLTAAEAREINSRDA